MFKISAMHEKARLVVVFREDFEHGAKTFEDAFKNAASEIKQNKPWFDLLVVWDNDRVMTREEAKQGEQVIDWCFAHGLRKAANVTQTVLQRIQVKRVSAQDDRFQYFDSLYAAEKWLDD